MPKKNKGSSTEEQKNSIKFAEKIKKLIKKLRGFPSKDTHFIPLEILDKFLKNMMSQEGTNPDLAEEKTHTSSESDSQETSSEGEADALLEQLIDIPLEEALETISIKSSPEKVRARGYHSTQEQKTTPIASQENKKKPKAGSIGSFKENRKKKHSSIRETFSKLQSKKLEKTIKLMNSSDSNYLDEESSTTSSSITSTNSSDRSYKSNHWSSEELALDGSRNKIKRPSPKIKELPEPLNLEQRKSSLEPEEQEVFLPNNDLPSLDENDLNKVLNYLQQMRNHPPIPPLPLLPITESTDSLSEKTALTGEESADNELTDNLLTFREIQEVNFALSNPEQILTKHRLDKANTASSRTCTITPRRDTDTSQHRGFVNPKSKIKSKNLHNSLFTNPNITSDKAEKPEEKKHIGN